MDKHRDGTMVMGSLCPASKLTWEDVEEIRRRATQGRKRGFVTATAKEYGVAPGAIARLLSGRTWRSAA
jgi:hypothetical protein